jgi:hypothetical protein
MQTLWFGLLTCVCLACAEVLNGILRLRYLVRWLGKQTAQAVSVLTGLSLAAAVCIYFATHWQVRNESGLWAMGVALSAFMAAFDVAVGRWLMRRSWGQITADFDPRGGNYLSVGLVLLCVVPRLVG